MADSGTAPGRRCRVDEPIQAGLDIRPRPHTTLSKNAEFLTLHLLRVQLLRELPSPNPTHT